MIARSFSTWGHLDGDGLHWLERFLALYKAFGVDLSRESVRDAFDEAERRSVLDDNIASSDFQQMIELHVKWQMARLGLRNTKLERHLVEGFVEPVREAVTSNMHLLADLAGRGFKLGVISNGCGNVERL
jgi:hypothetical protein